MTAKLPILNPGEYGIWLMRIEQYFFMTNYSLWEVIKNGNKVLKRTVGKSEETYEPTSAEEKLDRRNEMKSRGTLLMALPKKDQLKFHSHQDAKLLMEAIEKRAPKNQDNRGREFGRKTVLVETPIENALIAKDGIGGYDWSYQAEEEILTNYAFMAHTSSRSSSSSKSEVDSSSNSCMKAYDNLKEQYDSLTLDYKKSQYNLLSYKAGLQSVEERLVHYKKNKAVLIDKINILNLEGNKAHLANYQEFKGGSVAFVGSNERITGKGNMKTGS
nr:hypothetical protein [Tanacetum cinerariifolium]